MTIGSGAWCSHIQELGKAEKKDEVLIQLSFDLAKEGSV